MAKVIPGIEAARRATAYVCDRERVHKGQGLLLDLNDEGAVVLTCHHVIAAVKRDDLCVRIPQGNGEQLGEPIPVQYDEERSRPEKDAVVLRVEGVRLDERPLLHKLNLDKHNGSLDATVLTHKPPYSFNAEIRESTGPWPLNVKAETKDDWPDTPESYEIRAFRLRAPDDARRGISGGVVLCEKGVLGLVHLARAESGPTSREDYVVPLTVWAEGWDALDGLIEPLIDRNLRAAATVKLARLLGVERQLGTKQDNQLEIGPGSVMSRFRDDIYIERGIEDYARAALERHGGVVIVGRPHSGKTRLAWQLLRERPEALVVVPHPNSSRPPDEFEESGLAGYEVLIFFDDLHSTAETMQVLVWRRRLEEASGRSCLLVCTSRDGEDWNTVNDKQPLLVRELGSDATVFTSRVSEHGAEKGWDLSEEQGRRLAVELGLSEEEFEGRFRGTPGSLLLDFDDMRRRYDTLGKDHHGGVSMSRLLDSAKLLHEARQPSFRAPILKAVGEEIRGAGRLSAETWDAVRRRTQEEGFGRFDDAGNLQIYRPYLEQCVSYKPPKEQLKQLQPILVRKNDSDGLFYLGVRWLELTDYEQARACYDEALYLRSDDPDAWGTKGIALAYLGRYEEAIKAYDEALNLRSNYPEAWINKGIALHNLGRYDEAVNWLCRAWRAREHLPDNGALVAATLRELGRDPRECEPE